MFILLFKSNVSFTYCRMTIPLPCTFSHKLGRYPWHVPDVSSKKGHILQIQKRREEWVTLPCSSLNSEVGIVMNVVGMEGRWPGGATPSQDEVVT
jgi:hypothetical protein